jgi:hypothetical protein
VRAQRRYGLDVDVLQYCNVKTQEMMHIFALQHHGCGPCGSGGQKKARYGSGLNLSLEENRGDRFIMLHRKKEIQFKMLIGSMDFIYRTAGTWASRSTWCTIENVLR